MDKLTKKKKYANAKKPNKLYPVNYFPRNSGLIGLQNLGNTCYMNAALQALSNCPQLTSYMLENFDHIKPGLAKNFALLLYEIWVHGHLTDYSNQTNHRVFYDYLTPTSILYGIKNACPNFRSAAQQDAQEFLREFLSEIHEELKIPVNNSLTNNKEEDDKVEDKENNSLSKSDTEDEDPPYSNDLLHSSIESLTNVENINNSINESKINETTIKNDLIDKALLDSINDDYILNENNQITPGLGDVINENSTSKFLNGEKELNVSNENDQNFLNFNQNSEYINDHQSNGAYHEFFDYFKREKNNSYSDDKFSEDDEKSFHFNFGINMISKEELDKKQLHDYPNKNKNYQLNDNQLTDGQSIDHKSNEERTKEKGFKKVKKSKVIYQSIISEMFDGEILNSVQCLSCKNVSTIKETFQDLSLPIPNKEDLLQTRQANNYLKSLENNSYSSLNRSKKRIKEQSIEKDKIKIKNGLIYKKLSNSDEDEASDFSKTIESSNKLSNDLQIQKSTVSNSRLNSLRERFIKLPVVKYLFIILLYINYFFKAYLLYFLFSMFYWSQTNLWGPTITLNDCLDAFFSSDELKDNNMYSCEKCKKLRNGIKYTNLVKSPDILCIHFKRFRNELMFPSKISTYVSFPLKGLNMSNYMYETENDNQSYQLLNAKYLKKAHPDHQNSKTSSMFSDDDDQKEKSDDSQLVNQQNLSQSSSLDFNSNHYSKKCKRNNEIYDLVSVICHRGHYNSGHYITYALNCLDECWYEYDDKSVRKVDENKVLNCESYVLFYKRNFAAATEFNEHTDQEQLSLLNDDENETLLNDENDDNRKLSFLRNKFAKPDKSLVNTTREMFRKRKNDKINGELDYLNQFNDILGDLKL